ncbi:uncharacterized protein [Heterodontus francisci]|uniref:uncharacterized protein n=1 Tax=Heterodontus francisci TaxID=7792 RepID=UPI00355B0CC1
MSKDLEIRLQLRANNKACTQTVPLKQLCFAMEIQYQAGVKGEVGCPFAVVYKDVVSRLHTFLPQIRRLEKTREQGKGAKKVLQALLRSWCRRRRKHCHTTHAHPPPAQIQCSPEPWWGAKTGSCVVTSEQQQVLETGTAVENPPLRVQDPTSSTQLDTDAEPQGSLMKRTILEQQQKMCEVLSASLETVCTIGEILEESISSMSAMYLGPLH